MPSRRRQKYGELSLPLVVAVNVDSEHCDDIDINNALFGNEVIQFVRTPDGSCDSGVDTRLPNGVLVRQERCSESVRQCGSDRLQDRPVQVRSDNTTVLVLPSYRLPGEPHRRKY